MFDKIGRLAEGAATRVSMSRRGFLGRLGQAALGAAGVLGGLLVLPGSAQAGGGVVCCHYQCGNNGKSNRFFGGKFFLICEAAGTACPPVSGCNLQRSSPASDCAHC
jgi:hypothetical protein